MEERREQRQDFSTMTTNYCESRLPAHVVTLLEAAAFRSLRQHLQERSDVQNMELMALSGFCRNCLAKWIVLEARRLVDSTDVVDPSVAAALNALGYEEAAHHVYGMTIKTWKERYQKKATDEMMEKFNNSKPLQAKHDKSLLEKRMDVPPSFIVEEKTPAKTSTAGATLSNVCCQDVDGLINSNNMPALSLAPALYAEARPKQAAAASYIPPSLPTFEPPCKIAIITVSDRAFRGEYETGDLSGPAVREAIEALMPLGSYELTPIRIVPDVESEIKDAVLKCADSSMDVVLTTGGTGMGSRDVTPEATKAVIDVECPSLLAFCTTECSRIQPLASLSRGTAGILGTSMVANLPGNPNGAREIIPILLPLLLHAVEDLRISL